MEVLLFSHSIYSEVYLIRPCWDPRKSGLNRGSIWQARPNYSETSCFGHTNGGLNRGSIWLL